MTDEYLGNCPRCGAPFAPDDLAPYCSRCVRLEATNGISSRQFVRRRRLEPAPRRPALSIAWFILGTAAISWMFSLARDRPPMRAPRPSLVLEKSTGRLRQGKRTEAIAELCRVIKAKPRDFGAHHMLAVALDREGKFEEAIAEYRVAISLGPFHPGVHHNLGVILAERGQLDEAIELFRKAIRMKTEVGAYHTDLARALQAQGKLPEAIAEYRNAAWYSPATPNAHLDLGNALAAQGNLNAAIAELRRARDHAPPGTPIAQRIKSSLAQAEAKIRKVARAPHLTTDN